MTTAILSKPFHYHHADELHCEIYQTYKYQTWLAFNTDGTLTAGTHSTVSEAFPQEQDLIELLKDWVSYAIQHQTGRSLPVEQSQ